MPEQQIISTPMIDVSYNFLDTVDSLPEGVGIAEKIGFRSGQEDAVFYKMFDKNFFDKLNPINIAYRLWTTVHCLDMENESGSTASVTAYDGKDTFVTATLGDSTTFVAMYGKDGQPLGVRRLHDILHNVKDSLSEKTRILSSGGSILWGRVNGNLCLTRALGDSGLRTSGVIADAHMNIWTIKQLCNSLEIKTEDVGKIQLITACDGLTEAVKGIKQTQEKFIFDLLKRHNPRGKLSESSLASCLTTMGIESGSRDNISVAIQTITKQTRPFLAAIFDGHGGRMVSSFAARWIGVQFERLCALNETQYNLEEFSVAKHKKDYDRDNKNVEENFYKTLSLEHAVRAPLLADAKNDGPSEEVIEVKNTMLQAIEKYLPHTKIPNIEKKAHDVLLLLQNEVGLKESLNLTPEQWEMLLKHSDSIQRMVIDAEIPLASLLTLNAENLEAVFQHEYIVYCLRKEKVSLEDIVIMLFDPQYTEELQRISSFVHLRMDCHLVGILKNASPAMRNELYEHASEVGLIANDLLNELPEKNKNIAFLDHWFAIPDVIRQERYQKIALTKTFFKKGYLHYKDLPMLDLAFCRELNSKEKSVFSLIEKAHLPLDALIELPPQDREYLINNFNKMHMLIKHHHYTCQEFVKLPKDVLDMEREDFQRLSELFVAKVFSKQDFLAYSPEKRKFLIKYSLEMEQLASADIDINEFFNKEEHLRAFLLRQASSFSYLSMTDYFKNIKMEFKTVKKRLFELYTDDAKELDRILTNLFEISGMFQELSAALKNGFPRRAISNMDTPCMSNNAL